MEDKYLLYLDILGFSNMVADGGYSKIERIYEILDDLNVHRHPDFKAIVFSDTLLVYNDFEARTDDQKQFAVMFLAEFAQDLMYRAVGEDFFFRATIKRGPFADKSFKNIRAFYGSNLVESHHAEKKINSVGLFIHENCIDQNYVFPMVKYGNGYNFLVLNQALQRLKFYHGSIPIPKKDIVDLDLYDLVQDIRYFQALYHNASSHENPLVRVKYLQAWNLYEKYFGKSLTAIRDANFEVEALCPSFDWKKLFESWQKDEAEYL